MINRQINSGYNLTKDANRQKRAPVRKGKADKLIKIFSTFYRLVIAVSFY